MSEYRKFFSEAKLARTIKWGDLRNVAESLGIRDSDEILEFYWVDEGMVIVRNNEYTILIPEKKGIRDFNNEKSSIIDILMNMINKENTERQKSEEEKMFNAICSEVEFHDSMSEK